MIDLPSSKVETDKKKLITKESQEINKSTHEKEWLAENSLSIHFLNGQWKQKRNIKVPIKEELFADQIKLIIFDIYISFFFSFFITANLFN